MNNHTTRPNVLVIVPHDLGDHLGCYGHRTVRSPNLDAFAAGGVRLGQYFTAAPECTPSRAGMFTGRFTHQNGLMGLCHRGWEFGPGARHLAQHLKENGYQTHLFGFQHETGGDAFKLGYSRLHSQRDKNCGAVCREFVNFLAEAVDTQPWFAHLGFRQVHRSSGWPEQSSFNPRDIEVPPYLPDNETSRAEFARYHQCIADMDYAVGEVFDALENSSARANTLVIFTTDHGIPFPHAKSTYYDPGMRTAFLCQWPEQICAPAVHDALLSNLDLCPTILDACGVDRPENLAGRSFLALLEGQAYQERDAVFGALYYDAMYDPMHCVRTRKFKYIRSFAVTEEQAAGCDSQVLARHETGLWIRADDTDVQNSDTWKTMEGPFGKVPPEELYDLEADPLETNNLAGDEAHRPVLHELREQMQEMMEQTRSPLLHGHVSPGLSRTGNRPV